MNDITYEFFSSGMGSYTGLAVFVLLLGILAMTCPVSAAELNDSTIPPPDIDPYGTVRSWNGDPIENATVRAMDGGLTVAENTTSSSGAYNLILPPGTYEIVASAENYTSSSLIIDVDEPLEVNFELAYPNSFYGTVHDTSGAPLENVIIEVRDQMGTTIAENYTDSAGRYMVNYGRYFDEHPGIIQADLTLMAFNDDLFTETYNILMGPGESSRVDFEMEYLTSIGGTVRGQKTLPSGIPVTILLEGENRTGYTDRYGNFYFELREDEVPLVRGIRVDAYGYHPWSSDLTLQPGDDISLNIILNERALLTVNVTSSGGEPVERAIISFAGMEGCTGEDGSVKLAVDTGELTVHVSHPLYAPENRTIEVYEGENSLSIELIRLGLPVEVRGVVVDGGTPLEGAEVVLIRCSRDTHRADVDV
ncbi:carboxypeptidase-like regulatory domain-containing protein [Methanothermobacter sp.]|uniref:carboxypeptidase-like regulatory domain-containing protein n=1 Tax=Methanothermobacter sp. TaxID=1884223 RepID=UPI003C77BE63